MNNKHIIFDVGANDGQSFIHEAKENNNIHIYAFEPVPELLERLYDSSKELDNYTIIPNAVSDYNGEASFNIRGVDDWGQGSLSDFTDNVDIVWPKGALKFTDRITVNVIRLDKFIVDNDIQVIDYLHIDAQGNDLNVLKGLGEHVSIVRAGVVEASNPDKTYYVDQNTIDDTINFLEESGFTITDILANDNRDNEFNIYFIRNSSSYLCPVCGLGDADVARCKRSDCQYRCDPIQ